MAMASRYDLLESVEHYYVSLYIYIAFYICLHALTWSVSQNLYWIRSNALAQTFLQPAISTPNMSASLGPPETDNPYGIPKTKCQENGIVIQASFTRDSSPAGSKMGLPFMTTSTPVTGWLWPPGPQPEAPLEAPNRSCISRCWVRMGQVLAAWSPLVTLW